MCVCLLGLFLEKIDVALDQVENQSAIDLIDFCRHMEVASLEATEEIMAVASFLSTTI